MSTREAVLAALAQVRAEKGLPPASPPAFDDAVEVGEAGLGLDSLDMATVVAELEDRLGLDPFASGDARFRTVGELVGLYERAAAA